MEPPAIFEFLDITSLWPATDAAFREWARHVSVAQQDQLLAPDKAQGVVLTLDGISTTYSRSGIIQICLLQLPLFRNCAANEICDLREEAPHVRHRFQTRPQLIALLGDVLLRREDARQAPIKHVQERLAPLQHLPELLGELQQIHDDHLKTRGAFRRSVPRQDRMRQEVWQTLHALGADALRIGNDIPSLLRAAAPPKTHRPALIRTCYDALARYGPQHGFGVTARLAATYIVLAGFGIEEQVPSLNLGAERMRNTLRTFHMLPTRPRDDKN